MPCSAKITLKVCGLAFVMANCAFIMAVRHRLPIVQMRFPPAHGHTLRLRLGMIPTKINTWWNFTSTATMIRTTLSPIRRLLAPANYASAMTNRGIFSGAILPKRGFGQPPKASTASVNLCTRRLMACVPAWSPTGI